MTRTPLVRFSSPGMRPVKFPKPVYNELREIQERVFHRDGKVKPLWECAEERVLERYRWKDSKERLGVFDGRRGNIMDMFTILFILACALVVMVVFVAFINGFNTSVQADTSIGSSGKTFMSNIQSQNGWSLDFIFVMALINLPLVSAVLAYFNNIPPFFFWGSIGVLMLVILMANVVGDLYTNVANVNGLSTVTSSLPMTNFIMSHFVIYGFLCSVLILFGVFLKPQGARY